MRKEKMNMKELHKYNIIKKFVEKGGNKKRIAVELGCTKRHVNRLIRKYKEEGKQAFIHMNKGRSPSLRYSNDIKREIINLYINKYSDANIKHFSEIVFEELNIKISSETIRLWLLDEKILSPKSHRSTKKKIRKELKEDLKKATSKKEENIIKTKIEEVDKDSAHPRRPRCKYFGEMIQMDASQLQWIKDVTWHLHLAVDDATGTVVGAYFDTQETLKGYFNVLFQILVNYGIPAIFYTDRRTVFDYKRKARAFDDEDTFTQFSYACSKLGINIKVTSVPQAKGRIERLNSTFQSRLPIELRRANITTIEEANLFLASYLEKYNQQFALHLNITKSVFEKSPKTSDIYNYLAVLNVRTIDHGHTIHFKNKVYMPANKNGYTYSLQEGMKVIMIETFDGRLMMNVFDDLYYAKEINIHEDISKEFDPSEDEKIFKYSWNLPRKYSWHTSDFLGYLAKQKHRQDKNQNLC